MTHAALRRQIARVLAAVLITSAGMIGIGAMATPAQALCVRPSMVGDWRNINASTRSITRVVVGFHCGDQILCDETGHCTGGESYFTVHPYGKCTPTDCDWGTRRTKAMAGGWQRAIYTSTMPRATSG